MLQVRTWLAPVVTRGKRAARARLEHRAGIQAVHRSVFEALSPDELAEFGDVTVARDRVWQAVSRSGAARWVLWSLSRLDLLASPRVVKLYEHFVSESDEGVAVVEQGTAQLRDFLRSHAGSKARSLTELPKAERRAVLDLLSRSPLALHRRVALGIRMLYYAKLFEGRLGRTIAGVSEPSVEQWTPEPSIQAPRFETHLRFNARTRELEGELDYLVVGSGCAGSVLAHELQRAGKRVLVVESGSFFMPGTYDARAGLDFYEAKGLRTTADGGVFVLNGEAVGGGGTINVDMAFPPTLPIIAARVERWREDSLIPSELWTQSELARASDWVAAQFGTRHVTPVEVNAHNRLLLDGGRKRGLNPVRYELNTFAPGASPRRRSDKRGPVETLLLPAMTAARRPATLLPDTRVLRVLFEGTRAVGVELEVGAPMAKAGILPDPCSLGIPTGTRLCVRARRVVLAAGNLGSSAILLRSKVAHPGVGRGFVMHPFMLAIGRFEQQIDGHTGLSSSVYASDFISRTMRDDKPDFLLEVAAARPEVVAAMCPGAPHQVFRWLKDYRHLGGLGVVLLDTPDPNNRVRVDRAGQARIEYRLSASDKRRFAHGVVEGVKILFEAGAQRVLVPSSEPISGDAEREAGVLNRADEADQLAERLLFKPNQTPLFAAHMMSGNKLARSARLGVVSPEHEVYGTSSLYVVDASVFPSSIGANPMQAIYAIAKLFCDRHLAEN